MKKLVALLLIAVLSVAAINQKSKPVEPKVEDLLKKMTLEEKVGQMTQVTLAVVAKGAWANEDGSLDPALLKKAVVDYKVGSLLNTTAHASNVETWRKIIT